MLAGKGALGIAAASHSGAAVLSLSPVLKPLCWMPPGPAGGREGARPGRCERRQGWRRSDTHPECWFCEDRGSLRLPASPQPPARRPKCPHTEQGSSETQARHTQHSTILGFGASWPSTLFPRSWSALRGIWGGRGCFWTSSSSSTDAWKTSPVSPKREEQGPKNAEGVRGR